MLTDAIAFIGYISGKLLTDNHSHVKSSDATTRPPDYEGHKKCSSSKSCRWRMNVMRDDELNDNDSKLCTIGQNRRRPTLRQKKKIEQYCDCWKRRWCEMHEIGTQTLDTWTDTEEMKEGKSGREWKKPQKPPKVSTDSTLYFERYGMESLLLTLIEIIGCQLFAAHTHNWVIECSAVRWFECFAKQFCSLVFFFVCSLSFAPGHLVSVSFILLGDWIDNILAPLSLSNWFTIALISNLS